MDEIKRLEQAIKDAKNIVVFTGAGISVPSGIPDFRSADGIYNKSSGTIYSPEEIISHSFYKRHPDIFYDFYLNKMVFTGAKPNDAHKFFASLEKAGKNVTVVTQNIDGLHQEAGSTRVLELHGSVKRNYCLGCGKFFPLEYMLKTAPQCKCDKCGGTVKPDVVLYEESLDGDTIEKSVDAISKADLLIIVGTSLTVYPAAGFIRFFRGDTLCLINKSRTNTDSGANITIYDDVINVVHALGGKFCA